MAGNAVSCRSGISQPSLWSLRPAVFPLFSLESPSPLRVCGSGDSDEGSGTQGSGTPCSLSQSVSILLCALGSHVACYA